MIKFLDLKGVNESFEPDLSRSIRKVLDSGWYLLGNEVSKFEADYKAYIGTRNCIGVANGLDALRLILKAWIEIGILSKGDEVIVPANTYIASILAITDNQLIPVLIEPDIDNYNLNISLIERNITPKTRAIMVVHLFGKACWLADLEDLAKKYDLKIIEDNAQAAGAMTMARGMGQGAWKSERAKPIRSGSLGHAAGHSFYPGKNLGAIGDGGAVTTDDDELANVIRALANYGSTKKYVNNYQGLNSRLDEVQAAVLRVKLKRLDEDNQNRRKIAQYYLDNINHPDVIVPNAYSLKPKASDLSNVWHLFVIRHPNRDRLQNYLADNDIQTLIHYPIPPHKQKAYKAWNKFSFPITEKIHTEVLSLPISQVMTLKEAMVVVKIINKFYVVS